MKPRAIKDLSQLNNAELVSEVSEGLCLCVRNALRLWRDARKLRVSRRPHRRRCDKQLLHASRAWTIRATLKAHQIEIVTSVAAPDGRAPSLLGALQRNSLFC